MTIQNQLVGAKEGDTVHLDCHSEAFPRSINYWTINDQIISQCKYLNIPTACTYLKKISFVIRRNILKNLFLLNKLIKRLLNKQGTKRLSN